MVGFENSFYEAWEYPPIFLQSQKKSAKIK